jgi:hypothetical protein
VVDTLKWDQLHAAAAAVGIELPRQPPRDSELDQDWNVRAPAFLKALKVPSSRKNSVVRNKSIRGANVAGAQLFGVRQDSIQPPQLQPQYLDQVPEDDVVESSLSQQDSQILDVSDDLPVVHANRISQAETDSRVHMLLLRAQVQSFAFLNSLCISHLLSLSFRMQDFNQLEEPIYQLSSPVPKLNNQKLHCCLCFRFQTNLLILKSMVALLS